MTTGEFVHSPVYRGIRIPTDSRDLENHVSLPVPTSPFSEAANPAEDSAPISRVLYDADDADLRASSDSNEGRNGWITECLLWFASCRTCFRPKRYQSDYIVLFRDEADLGSSACFLSDPRLKPRLPKLLIAFLILLSLGGILCVFFLVPRGVTLADIKVDVVSFTLSGSNQSYNLLVDVYLPFHNPNYVDVDVSGYVKMTYYNANAGVKSNNFTIPKRTTANVTIKVDASGVPMKYISTVFQHCFSFPYQLVFFIDGAFKGKYLLQTQNLTVDAYKYIHCPVPFVRNSSFVASV